MLWCLQITSTYLAHREQSQHMIRLDPNTVFLDMIRHPLGTWERYLPIPINSLLLPGNLHWLSRNDSKFPW